MKLSVNAREYIINQVKAAFADEYKKAEEAEEAVTAKAAAKWEKFRKDLDAVAEKARKEAMALIRKHGLTLADKDDDDDVRDPVANVEFRMSGSYYSSVCENTFRETSDGRNNPEYWEAHNAVNAVAKKIGRATSKALFEIEIHGRKSDLEQIVADVIKSIKEEK